MGVPDAGVPDAGGVLDAGSPRVCPLLPFTSTTSVRAGYFTPTFDAPSTVATLGPSGSGPFDFLDVELWYFGASANPTFPYSVMLWATTRARCDVCVMLRQGCDAAGSRCAAAFLANGGELVTNVASRDADAGRFAGSATVLRFVQWDFSNDVELDGGRCVEVPGMSFDVSW